MPQPKRPPAIDYGLELLLDYDGRIEYLPEGYHLKFEIKRAQASDAKPHGLSYSFTLHDARNKRIVGFDNAHGVKPLGRSRKKGVEHDHWHRTSSDKGRPYTFVDAANSSRTFTTKYSECCESAVSSSTLLVKALLTKRIDGQ
jgi:hypothetical protein